MRQWPKNFINKVICGDALKVLQIIPNNSIQVCVTSPPYFGLRDYGNKGQIGAEKSVDEYIEKLLEVFSEVKRVLKNNGTFWLNIGDSYNGYPGGVIRGGRLSGKNQHARQFKQTGYGLTTKKLKQKDLMGIPWRIAFALQVEGWYLRQDIIWSKPNPMPESITDRCTKAHEYIFLLSKSKRYYYDNEAIKEPAVSTDKSVRNRDITKLNNTPGRTRMGGLKTNHYEYRNLRSVWTVAAKPFKGAHFAVFPMDLIEPCVLAGCPKGGIVLDLFGGSGTVGVVAKKHKCNYILIDLNSDYCKMARQRIKRYKC